MISSLVVMVGPGLSARAVESAYEQSKYPLSPSVLRSDGERFTPVHDA
jgi:hypothetical protein